MKGLILIEYHAKVLFVGKSSFFCLNKMKRGKQMKKTRRIVSLAICIAMLLSVCLFTGCSDKSTPVNAVVSSTEHTENADTQSGADISAPEQESDEPEEEDDESFLENIIPNHLTAESAFEAFMNAQQNADVDAILDLVPPAYFDYRIAYGVSRGKTEEEARKSLSQSYRPLSMSVDLKEFGPDYDPATECEYFYQIIETKEGTSEQVKEVNDYFKGKFDFKLNAKKVVVIKYAYVIKSKSGKLDTREIETYGVAFKIKGDWYFHEGGIIRNDLWMTQKGLLVEDGVKWIMDYVEVSYDF